MTRARLTGAAVLSALALTAATAVLVSALQSGRLTIGAGGSLAFAAIAVIGLLIVPATRLRGAAAFTWVFAAVLVVDQVTKYVGWRWADFPIINPGADGVIAQVSPIYINPSTGAGMDVLSASLLAGGAWLLLRRPRTRAVLVGGALVWAGFASNLSDRLGMTELTAPGVNRGAVDWIGVRGGNVADYVSFIGCVIVVSGLILARVHLSRPTRVAVVATLVVVTSLAGAGTVRQETTRPVAACTPVEASTNRLPDLELPAGTVGVAWTISGHVCNGTDTPASSWQFVTVTGSDGTTLASARLADLTKVIFGSSFTVYRLPVPPAGTTLMLALSVGDEGAHWVRVADGTWLLSSGHTTAPGDQLAVLMSALLASPAGT